MKIFNLSVYRLFNNKKTVLYIAIILLFAAHGNIFSQSKEYRVQISDEYMEFWVTDKDSKYVIKDNWVDEPQKRELYNKIINKFIYNDNEYNNLIKEELETEKKKHDFLDTLYTLRDSKVWCDGHTYILYVMLLDYKNYGSYGYMLADKAVKESITQCDMRLISSDFLLIFISDTRPQSKETLTLIAECSLEKRAYYNNAIAAALALARINCMKDSISIIDRIEELGKYEEDIMNMCESARDVLIKVPQDNNELYDLFFDIFA